MTWLEKNTHSKADHITTLGGYKSEMWTMNELSWRGQPGLSGKRRECNVSLICSWQTVFKDLPQWCSKNMLFVYDQRQFDNHFKTVIVGLMILPRNKDSLYLIWKIVNIVPTWVTRWQLGKMAGQMQDDIIMVPLWCLRYTGPSLALNYLKNIKQDCI